MKPNVDELAESFNGNNERYNTRIENRLSCNNGHFYKYLGNVNGYAPECRPFDCYYNCHGGCLEDWKLFFLKQNKGVTKQINCSYCRCPVGDVFDNLYTCKWKVDGSGVKLPSNSKIEIVNVDNSKKSEETDTPNFRERQNLALTDYNAKLKVTQENYRAYVDKNRL